MTVSSYDDAYSQMLAAVQSFDALGKFGITVSDETDDQGEHSIVLTASGAADSFSATLCKYITVTEVTSNIQFESAEYGSYVLADGVITQIVTTVDGWTACTNDITPIKGRLTQTDAEARTSYTNRVASRGTGTVASIVSLLYSDVEGVTFAAGYENYNDTTDAAGRPPHSIEIVVQGGTDEDVANIIWKNKAGGIRAYGKHYAYATDVNGNRQYLEFTRVNDVYLLLSITVTSSGGLDDDYAARIKSLLIRINDISTGYVSVHQYAGIPNVAGSTAYTSNWVAELFGPSNLKKSTSGFPQRLYNSVLQGALGIDKDGIKNNKIRDNLTFS